MTETEIKEIVQETTQLFLHRCHFTGRKKAGCLKKIKDLYSEI